MYFVKLHVCFEIGLSSLVHTNEHDATKKNFKELIRLLLTR